MYIKKVKIKDIVMKRLNINDIVSKVSKVMYEYDPAHTSCGANDGMENEYDTFASMLVCESNSDLSYESINNWLIDNFTGYFGFCIEDEDAETLSKSIIKNIVV